MPSPFKSNIFLKVGSNKIATEILLVPMWHPLVTYLSIGLVLIEPCDGEIHTLEYPILLPVGDKWSLLHHVQVI
jgi:hypothetical protein